MRDGKARREREVALSEVVGFVLLLGVIVAAMALWMMYVVPAEGREDEIAQMNDVKDRFTDYKITLDSLWINSLNRSVASMAGVTTSTSFNLGTGGGSTQAGGMFLPMMKPLGSPATLSIVNSGDWMNITTTGSTGGVDRYDSSISKMVYQSQNYYWIQQTYYYQAGGVFLSQDNGATTRVSPPISIINSSAGTTRPTAFTVSFIAAPITLDGGASIGGNGPVRVDSRLKANPYAIGPIKKSDVRMDVIVPDHTSALMWKAAFLDALSNGAVTNTSWYEVRNSTPGATPSWAYVKVIGPYTDSTEDVWFTMQKAEFAVTFNSIASSLM